METTVKLLKVIVPLAALLATPKAIKFVKERWDELHGCSAYGRAGCSGRCCDPETGRPFVTKDGADKLDRRVEKLEAEIAELKQAVDRQAQLIGRLVQNMNTRESIRAQESGASHGEETRSDADYVDLAGGKSSRASPYEFVNWTSDQVVAWVERIIGNDSQNGFFANVDGNLLSGMVFEHDHGLSFADKCFFLGVDRESCVALERAVVELIK